MQLESKICDQIVDLCNHSTGKEYTESKLLLSGDQPFFSPWRYTMGMNHETETRIWKAYVAPPNTNVATKRTVYKLKQLKNMLPEAFLNKCDVQRNNAVVGVFRMPPGNFTIPHYDLFGSFKGQKDSVKRLWVTLSEPEFGHLLWIEGSEPKVNLPKGYVVNVSAIGNRLLDKLHIGANLGYVDRWFMTITGVPYETR